jgi:hypothetical protein
MASVWQQPTVYLLDRKTVVNGKVFSDYYMLLYLLKPGVYKAFYDKCSDASFRLAHFETKCVYGVLDPSLTDALNKVIVEIGSQNEMMAWMNFKRNIAIAMWSMQEFQSKMTRDPSAKNFVPAFDSLASIVAPDHKAFFADVSKVLHICEDLLVLPPSSSCNLL